MQSSNIFEISGRKFHVTILIKLGNMNNEKNNFSREENDENCSNTEIKHGNRDEDAGNT
jgi:hypothetical protein